MNNVDKLNNRIFNKEKPLTEIESLIDIARELHCLDLITGKDYEVRDTSGKLIYSIRQKPIKTLQLSVVAKALNKLRVREQKEVERSSKKGKKK